MGNSTLLKTIVLHQSIILQEIQRNRPTQTDHRKLHLTHV